MGGSKKGVKKEVGGNPPLSYTGLTTMVNHTLKQLKKEVAQLMPTEQCALAESGDKAAFSKIVHQADFLYEMFSRFWVAVKTTYPEAWADTKKKTYLLFDSTGSGALSQLGAEVISEAIDDGKVETDDFVEALNRLRNAGVTFAKADYVGAAGLAGQKRIFDDLIDAKAKGDTGVWKVIDKVLPPAKSALDE
jgi:hypothetical protein